MSFYAIAKGRATGVYSSWAECEAQVAGYPGARYKKFSNAAEAQAWVEASAGTSSLAVTAPKAVPTHANELHLPSKASPKPTSVFEPVPTSILASTSKSTLPATTSAPSNGKRRLEEQVVEDESGWDVVYSDGACKGNGKVGSIAGIGVWWGRNNARNMAERCPGIQTNNRAELIAIVRVLETAPHEKRPLLIKTDSQYSINCFQTWLSGWEARGWKNSKGEVVKNKELIQYLSALLGERMREGQKVRLQYVRGHVGEEGNEGADALANLGATRPETPERDWDVLRARLESAPRTDPERVKPAPPEVVVPQAERGEFVASSQVLFSADVDVIDDGELEAYAAGLVETDDLLWDSEDDDDV